MVGKRFSLYNSDRKNKKLFMSELSGTNLNEGMRELGFSPVVHEKMDGHTEKDPGILRLALADARKGYIEERTKLDKELRNIRAVLGVKDIPGAGKVEESFLCQKYKQALDKLLVAEKSAFKARCKNPDSLSLEDGEKLERLEQYWKFKEKLELEETRLKMTAAGMGAKIEKLVNGPRKNLGVYLPGEHLPEKDSQKTDENKTAQKTIVKDEVISDRPVEKVDEEKEQQEEIHIDDAGELAKKLSDKQLYGLIDNAKKAYQEGSWVDYKGIMIRMFEKVREVMDEGMEGPKVYMEKTNKSPEMTVLLEYCEKYLGEEFVRPKAEEDMKKWLGRIIGGLTLKLCEQKTI